MKVTPIVMDDFLLIILTIPLTDQSLEIYNLPALHPKLKVEFTYQLEGEYLAITKNKLYAALPTADEIRICKGTEGYLCLMNQALYPVIDTKQGQKESTLYHQYTKERCQQGTKPGRLSFGSYHSEKGENANQMSNRHTCNRCENSTNHHTCRKWL